MSEAGSGGSRRGIELALRKLEAIGPLSVGDRLALEQTPVTVRHLGSDIDLARQGDQPSECTFLIEGFACSYRVLESGGRQILSFHVPGDICGPQSAGLGGLDHSIATLSETTLGAIPHATIAEWTQTRPGLIHRLWVDALLDSAIAREWVVNVGRRSAYQRIGHLLCELLTRLSAAGLGDGRSCHLPLTQGQLADATGLSTVHVNRVVQQLRRDGLVELRRRSFIALDWERLQKAVGFDPTYLRQPVRFAAALDPPGARLLSAPIPAPSAAAISGDRAAVSAHERRARAGISPAV